jgi:hypothetical protein
MKILADTQDAERFLDGLHRDQVPFAASLGLNQTAKDVQAAERVALQGSFILREPRFLLQSIRIPRFSNKNDPQLEVTVEIGPKASFLLKFQTGGEKVALDRALPIAIPSPALRPSPGAVVPRALYPKALRLVPRRDIKGVLPAQRHVTRRGVEQLKGKRRTFVLDPTIHFGVKTWGVYQRTGPGRGDIRLLWIYKQRIRIPQRFDFVPIGQRTAAARWPENFAQSFARAVRTAK